MPDDSREPTAAELRQLVPQRRLWPFVLIALALFGGAGFLAWRASRAPEPLRVLVAVDLDGAWWQGSAPAAALSDKLAARLSKLGFDPVRAGDPEVVAVLEKAKSPEEAARKLHAAFLVTGRVTPEVIEHPINGGYFETRVDAPIEVRHIDDAPGEAGRLTGWSGATTKPEALRLLAESLGNMAFDIMLPRLMGHASIKGIFDGSDVRLADRVAPAKQYVALRDKKMREATEAYEALQKEREATDKAGVKITYHGPASSQHTLGGAAQGGALVKTADVRLFFSPDALELYWISALETLEWRPPDGAGRVLWTGYNLYSYPSSAPEGGPVVLVEDLFGWAKTITVVGADGKAKRIRIDPDHRFLAPKVAKGGKAAALIDRACRDCPGGLLVVSLDDGHPLYEKRADLGSIGGFAWLDARRLAYLFTPADPRDAPETPDAPPRQRLEILDVEHGSVTVSFTAGKDEDYANPVATQDGGRLALELRGGGPATLALYDVEHRSMKPYDVGGVASSPATSPDGGDIAFEIGGDIAVVSVETGRVRRMTANRFQERYPAFSGDGTRVYFESLATDPVFPGRRVASVVASVPAR